MSYLLNGFVVTNVGKVRGNNEDNFYLFGEYKEDTSVSIFEKKVNSTSDNEAIAVFDGMGGEEAGEIASLLAAAGMASLPKSGDINENITNQVIRLNDRICTEIRNRNCGRSGTTFAGIYFREDKAVSANLGDSRCYLLRDNNLYQLSHDHSEAQDMMDRKLMTEDEARMSKKWHTLTQCLGVFPEEFIVSPFVSDMIEIKPNDRFMLCSDGLTDLIRNEEILELMSEPDCEKVVNVLVNEALERGGRDNVTVIVVDVV